jgi:iron complex outermembrane receptor protein
LWLALSAVLFLCLAGQMCLAGPSTENEETTALKQLSLEQLGNIEVTTASKEPETVWKTPAAIYVITHEAIMRSGATSIPEALRLAPGVEVARIDNDKWSIGIRGFGSRLCRDILVIIDGRTVYTTLLAGTYWEVQDTVMDDIDRIEVIRGPGATIWGPNAVNGVINIITKTAGQTQGELVAVGGGNVEQGFFKARYGGKDGSLDYRGYAKGFNRAPQFHSDGADFDHWRELQGGFRMDWAESKRDGFTLQGDLYDQRAGESVTSTTYAPPYSQTVDGNALLSGGNVLGRWKRTSGEGEDTQLQVYYDRTNRYEPNFTDIRNTFDVDFLQRLRLPLGQELSWGAGARFTHGYEPEVVSGLTFAPNRNTDRLLTAFFQDDIGLIDDKLSLSLGTKILNTNYTGVALQPSVRLLYTPTKTQTLWAAFTHAVRTPSAAEREFYLLGFTGSFFDGLPVFARFNANLNFHPEELNGSEIGYRRLVGKHVYVDVAGFYNHYGDLFSEDITGGPFIETNPAPTHVLIPAEFGNGLVGTTEGGEIAPEWDVTSFWRLGGSYSFLEMHIRRGTNSMDVGSAPGIEGASPQHQVFVHSSFDISKALTLDLLYRYVSALPGGMPSEEIRAYSSADATFGWNISRQFHLTVAGQNLLQPHHPENYGEPGPPVQVKRGAYAEITWQR